ncbi:transglutaminase [Hydrococcus rivularis NIES-593]|uniref:Transglutaminase n=1 Tax=Hydrococcus rivularis NIES-593 TaxID=1921803 RepID=A0A1U7HLR5_9CYAN|nr:transglutaminase family protein [Hydrococcus rivularis]OKH24533.1 transglutaminase [Hydrococcus rivularis NIES-593]
MLYHIFHKTVYTYNQPVFLKPHLLRLRPRCDGWQKLLDFSLVVEPQPTGISQTIDLDGNSTIQLWFTQPTEQLTIEVKSTVETYVENPFGYLLEPWATKLPIDYPSSLLTQLQPYLKPYGVAFDPAAVHLALEIADEVKGNTLAFLSTLNERIYKNCEYIIRETGKPWQAELTWKSKRGSCRDFSVLFMEVSRAIGLAARFVSGYQEGDLDKEERDLHAWVEVYLPGAGWRGYDPTHGLAVGDRHIALVASALPAYASPIVGTTTPVKSVIETGKTSESEMKVQISIKRED